MKQKKAKVSATAQSRRSFLTRGLAPMAGVAALAPFVKTFGKAAKPELLTDPTNLPPTPFKFTPFTVPLVKPPVIQPTALTPAPGSPEASLGSAAVYHGIAPEFSKTHPAHKPDWNDAALKTYKVDILPTTCRILPDVETPCLGFNAIWPGPTFISNFNEPCVVRLTNHGDTNASLHLHGGHTPAHADGHPNFYTYSGKTRDYYYPNIVPREHPGGAFDMSEVPSTMWYHDHANDFTAINAASCHAGFHLFSDDLEKQLIADNVLPPIYGETDVPLAFSDRRLNADGTQFWDPLEHNGYLGDLICINGNAFPVMKVQRRKYRFRFLGGALARVFHFKMSNNMPFLMIGNDAWLLPQAVGATSFTLTPAKRADVIIDFRNAPNEVFLQNAFTQTNGRGPDKIDLANAKPVMKFIVEGAPVTNDITARVGTRLRPHVPILPSEIKTTRVFNFERGNGVWQVNKELWDPRRADAQPELDSAERWILTNKSGGWWHPIHIHLEAHQIQTINGRRPSAWNAAKVDTSVLEGNTTVELFMKFRTFTGPIVFHCHNINHEDMRMMKQFDPRPPGSPSPLTGKSFSVPPEIAGIPAEELADPHNHLFL